GVVAFLGYYNLIGLSTFATQLLVTLAIAATTDYAIFLIGRYQEARTIGEDRESAFYTMFRGTAHVVLGSGMTIAGATFCLSFTRLPYFQTLGVPLAVGMVVAVLVALTLGPAIITVASRFGLLEPKRAMRIRFWRRLGAAVVRWPGWILVMTMALALVGLLTLPGYQPNYNDRKYLPADLPANEGYAAAERHFPVARMNPEMLLLETDRDVRNSTDFLIIDKITKAVTEVPGIGRVQSITRPEGKPLKYSTIPAQFSMSGTFQKMNRSYMQKTMNDMLAEADEMQKTIGTMNQMIALMEQMSAMTHDMVGKMNGMLADIGELRGHIADFDDFFRPIRSYLYWEPHCYDIPMCWSLRSTFDALDGIDTTTDDFQNLLPDLDRLDALLPQMLATLPQTIDTLKNARTMMLGMQASQSSMQDQMAAMQDDSSAMGKAFNDSHNDDTFYLPPEIFDNKDFKRGMDNFISP
ncbi:MAG TPA: MMPL family transporter, partial [Chloroflexota bacterium]|nr:MMPL family transporter [Chloroflexota bacterium]